MKWKFLFLCFSVSICKAQTDSVFATYMNDDILGLVRTCYPHVIVPAKYSEIRDVKPSCLFYVKSLEGLYGVIDSSGAVKVKPEYQDADVKIDHATKKPYVYLKKAGSQILVDEFGTITGKGFPTIKDIIGGYVIVQPDYRDTAEKRLYYTEEDKYVKEGLMDLKGNWIQKPGVKQFWPVYSQLLFLQDYNVDPEKGWLCDLKLQPLSNPKYTDIRHGRQLKNDSLNSLKRIVAYDKEFIWLLDSNGKELKKEVHKKLPIEIKGYSGERKSFTYNGNLITKNDRDYDQAFIMENFLLGVDSTAGITHVYDRKGNFLYEKKYGKLFWPWRRDDDPPYNYIFAQDKAGNYLLDDKLEKKTPALQHINTDELYNKNGTQLFVCKKNNKYGVIDQTGKIIVPFQYKNEPSRYTGNVIKVYGKTALDFYSISGEQLGKDADEVDESKIDPNIFVVTKETKLGLFAGNPYRALIPFGEYSSFSDYEEQKVIVATKDEKKYIIDKNGRVLNKEPIEQIFVTHDSVTLAVKYGNKKQQLLSYRSPEPKNSFDMIESFKNEYERESLSHRETPVFLVMNNAKYGLINTKSELLLDTEWDTIVSYGRCVALKKGKTYFLTNEKLEVDRDLVLDSIILETVQSPYEDRDWRLFKIKVRKAGKWGVFDLVNHQWIIYPNFDNEVKVLGKVNSAQRYYSTKINKWTYLVSAENGLIYGSGYDSITPVTNHARTLPYANLNKNLVAYKNGKIGITDPKGKVLHKCDADIVKPLAYTLQYPREHVYGYLWNIGGINKQHVYARGDSVEQEFVDANGKRYTKKVIEGRYYREYIAGGKFGIVDADGKDILPVIYDDITFMTQGGEGIGNVRVSYLDTLPVYDHQIFPIFLKKDGKWGVAELNGKIIAQVDYDKVQDAWLNNKRVIRLEKNGQLGYVDLLGKEIFPVVYSGERNYGNYYNQPELILFQKNGMVSSYTLPVISSTRQVKYDENGNETYVNDTIIVEQKSFTGGTYGLWDEKASTWALEPIYEDIRMLQEFDDMEDKRIAKRASVTGIYKDELWSFIKAYEPFEIKLNGKWGAYHHRKGIILKPEFDEIKIENDEIIVKQAGLEKRFDFDGKAK